MSQPSSFVNVTRLKHVCLLSKSLYDLKQSSRIWFQKFSSILIEFGSYASQYDPSLFILHSQCHITILLVYVDDILITGSNSTFITTCIQQLQHWFAIKDLGALQLFLGVEVNSSSNASHLSQSKCIMDLLIHTNIINA